MMSNQSLLCEIAAPPFPVTAAEMDEWLAWSSAHKRISDLHSDGYLKVVGRRPCSTSGKMARVWALTEKGRRAIR